jgi:hypothetical protein
MLITVCKILSEDMDYIESYQRAKIAKRFPQPLSPKPDRHPQKCVSCVRIDDRCSDLLS